MGCEKKGWVRQREKSEIDKRDASEIEKWWTKCVGLSIWSCFDTYIVSLQNPLFDLVCLSFLCYFLFLEERDIKVKIKYIFTPVFNKGG